MVELFYLWTTSCQVSDLKEIWCMVVFFFSTCSSVWKTSGREGLQILMARVRWEGTRGKMEGREREEISW